MVYGKLIYNNIKEYTPSWFKTIPYAQTVKPVFVRQRQVVSKFNSDPKVKAFWRLIQRNVQRFPWLWQVYIFMNAFVIFNICYYPWLLTYKANNTHRTLDYAIQKEKEYKASKQQEEE